MRYFYSLPVDHRLKNIRKDLNLTQSDLAAMCDTSLQMIQYLENGQRQITEKWLIKFSEVLKVPVWHLLVDPKTILDEFDSELASRFRDAPEDVQTTIKRLLGMMDMPYIQENAGVSMSIHDGGKAAKGGFDMGKAKKRKK